MKKIIFFYVVACLFSACHKHSPEHEHSHETENLCCEHETEEIENAIHFHSEQQEKIEFAAENPKSEFFGQVIHTTGLIEPAQTDESLLSAGTSGIVVFPQLLSEGQNIKQGQVLLTVLANAAANNMNVQWAEAKANYQKATAGYERAKNLANDKIVSDKELNEIQSQYETAKAVYDNLSKNFSSGGQRIASPVSGFVKQLFVANGQYVETGQILASVSRNQSLVLKADVPVKYAGRLSQIASASIVCSDKQHTYSLSELNGRLLSYGKSLNEGQSLLPVRFQIGNRGDFIPGALVEMYIQLQSNQKVITLPNSALTEEQGLFFVFVQLTDEEFEKREVTIGSTNGLRTEIQSGVTENEKVVTQGAMSVRLAQSAGALDPHAGHVH
ncbi:cation efflux system protein [Bacteroidia bacterium]|nr:cation efflux system protein [Bacteroidia bacterium]